MKANLIYDMRHDDDSWFDKFSREDRGQAVLDVLESARHPLEFDKIISGLRNDEDDYQRDRVRIEPLLYKEQKVLFETLKTKFKYIG